MNTYNEDEINECEFLIEKFEERDLNGQKSFIDCEPIKFNLCGHTEIKARKKIFYCEPDKHSWCPYNKE
ncbi:hypothetical protein [Aliarcobacter butzleri]|uniref:hypothetical protein n=1 Tax=Aliarcobacter butzleri TaxID=28197 RepID=UPI0021B172A4|nr:hypothetical protein [Aliarcobacter butzleri]MCT7586966.1 hypothetical protein [Aliarcobacter butzleri]